MTILSDCDCCCESNRLRVVLLISGRMYGGGQKVVLDLLGELAGRNDLQIRLVLLGCREPLLEAAASHVVPYDGRYNRLSTLLLTAWRLRAHLLNADRPGVLHTHGWDADLIGWLALVGTRIRQIIHLHVTPAWLESSRWKRQIRRFLTRRVLARPETRVIAVSNAVRSYWAERLPWEAGRIEVVYNAVDLGESPALDTVSHLRDPPRTIGLAARLEPMKGIEYLLSAMTEVTMEHPDVRLLVAGQGSLEDALQNRTCELGLTRSVEFLGYVQDMKSFYHTVDVLALPSIHTEGLPLTILEAMAAKIAVVATTVGGTPEVIRDGQDGLLVPPADSKALADAILRLFSDPCLRSRLGQNGYERVKAKFSVARSASEVLDIYRDRTDESTRC